MNVSLVTSIGMKSKIRYHQRLQVLGCASPVWFPSRGSWVAYRSILLCTPLLFRLNFAYI